MLWAWKVQMKMGRSHSRGRHAPGSTFSWSGPRASPVPPTFCLFPATGVFLRPRLLQVDFPGDYSIKSEAGQKYLVRLSRTAEIPGKWRLYLVESGRRRLWGKKKSSFQTGPFACNNIKLGSRCWASGCTIPYAEKLINVKQLLT